MISLIQTLTDFIHLTALQRELPIFIIIFSLLSAPLCLIFKSEKVAWSITLIANFMTTIVAWQLIELTKDGHSIRYFLGNWLPPDGIEFKVDILNASIAFLVSVMAFLVTLFAPHSISRKVPIEKRHLFYTAFLLCTAGLLGMLITGDAFNVFVFLEISSLSTYALIGLGSDNRSLTASFDYLIMGTIGATFYLIGVGFLFAMTGTLNMADLTLLLPNVQNTNAVHMAFAFITIGICIKVSVFTMHFWLPNAYTYANAAIAVFLAATATKVALYVLLRFFFVIFGTHFSFNIAHIHYLLIPLAISGIIIASIFAIFQQNVKRVMAYSSIAQLGYMILAISLVTHEGIRAAAILLFNHALIKGCLFMAMGCMVYRIGSLRISKFSGIAHEMPISFACFVIGGLSLIGVPLTAGFISKWFLLAALFDKSYWILIIVVLASSLIAVIYVWRVFEIAWFRPRPENRPLVTEVPLSMLIPTVTLAAANIYFGINAQPIIKTSQRIAQLLLGN